jgi:CUB/sushi domain-containing protein
LLSQTWNGSAPTCERLTCQPLPPLPNGNEVGDGRRYGDGVLFVCNPGYDLVGELMDF